MIDGKKKRIEILEAKVRSLENRLDFQKQINMENVRRLNRIEASLPGSNNASRKD